MNTITINAAKTTIDFKDYSKFSHELVVGLSLFLDDKSSDSLIQKTDLPLSEISQEKFSLYKVEGEKISIPTGVVPRLIKILNKHNIKFNIINNVSKFQLDSEDFNKNLYEHQLRLVQSALHNKRCILQSPTSSGKSYVIGELIRKMKSKQILITVSTIHLLDQLRKDIADYLGVPESSIGRMGDSIYEKAPITVALPNTLYSKIKKKDKETIEYLNQVEVWLADECHNLATAMTCSVSDALINTYYRIGLSATAWRSDGSNLIIEALLGPLTLKITESEMIEKGVITEPLIKFYNAPSAAIPSKILYAAMDKKNHWAYNQLYNLAIVNNTKRNQLAASLVKEYLDNSSYPIVIIVERVGTSGGTSHADIFLKELNKLGIDLPIIHGKTSKKKVEEVFEGLSNRSLRGAIAGPKILREGLSIKSLGSIMLLGAGSTSSGQIQKIGRSLRSYPGKDRAIIYDFMDGNSRFKDQSNKRLATVKAIYPNCVQVC